MERIPVSSSSIAEVGYEAESLTLEILFHHGGVYQYLDVPEPDYDALMAADSKGKHLVFNIKTAFRCLKL